MMLMYPIFIFACNGEKHAQEVEESYQNGQNDGYNSGYQDGQDEGFQDGYDVGLDTGYEDGYEEGYQDGYEEATTIQSGWELYADGSYNQACSSFLYDASNNGLQTDNANGLGWCHLRTWELEIASYWFEMAIALDETHEDAWVGLSSARMLTHDYEGAITAIDHVLWLNPSYSSSFEPIDERSLFTAHVLAQVFLKNDAAAAISLQDLDPNHNLQPLNPESWVIDNTTYPSFQQAIIAKLSQLGEI